MADTVAVGQTVPATAIKDSAGQMIVGAAAWRTSNAGVASVDAQGNVTGQAAGQATIFADIGPREGSAVVTVIAVPTDQRFGYALADQPAAAGPYSPDASYLFNSSGGAITITRSSPGVYDVLFAGLGRKLGYRDNVQVTTYGEPAGAYCKLGPDWQSSGSDMVAEVFCFAVNGTPADGRFTILLSGSQAYAPSTPVGFALRPSAFQSGSLDTALTAYNSSGGYVALTRVAIGNYSLGWPGLEKVLPGSPVSVQVTALGGTNDAYCRVDAIDPANSGLAVGCSTPDGVQADSRFSVLWISHGRPGLRIGYAWANNQTATLDYTPFAGYLYNSSGGAITARLLATGQYRVVFGGLARPAGASESVQVTAFQGNGNHCAIASWGTTGANDLTVLVNCYDATGAATDTRFNVLVIQ